MRNVLFVLVDDFGWKDVGYNGSTFYETPCMDQLASEFMVFDRCYTPSPMCSPTRVSIMTGKNPARHGVTQWLGGRDGWPDHDLSEQAVLCPEPSIQGLKDEEITLAEALKEAGYDTAFFGKWHMGQLEDTGGPKAHGFDSETAVIERNHCSMFYPFLGHPEYFPDAKEGDNFTDLLTDSAIDFIGRERDKPFFAYVSHFAMHSPIKSKDDLREKFQMKADKLPQLSFEEKLIHDSYAHLPYNGRQDSAEYAGELATLDENIGRIVKALKDNGQFDDTIIIITGDNGGRTAFFLSPPTAMQPLRGGKTFTFEGGLRTPLLIHWPGVTKPGLHTDAMVSSMDFYPTLLDMLGLPQRPEQHMDGISIAPVLKGEAIDRDTMYWHFPHYQGEGSYPTSAIRKGKYKLVVNYHQKDVLLYDVENDIGETRDLASEMPDVVNELKEDLMAYLNEVKAVIPEENPDYVPGSVETMATNPERYAQWIEMAKQLTAVP